MPKHIPKLRAEALGNNKDIHILPQQAHPCEETEDCHSNIFNHSLRPPAIGDRSSGGEEGKEGEILLEDNDPKDLKGKWLFHNLWTTFLH